MNAYLLNMISKVTGVVLISTISLFTYGVKNETVVVENDVINKNTYNVEYVEENVVTNEVESQIIIEKPVENSTNNELVEKVETETLATYNGVLTGYGPDCYGCSGLGNVACYTKAKTKFSLVTDGIYYYDETYGLVRILAADHRMFPCGTIIEVNNNSYEKELGIVLDTGGAMRNAYDNGYVLIDLAFEKESLAHSITNKQTTFNVKRLGW